jgi:hypothetical protein
VELLQFLPEQIYFEILMYYLSVHELYLGGGIHKVMFQRLDHPLTTIDLQMTTKNKVPLVSQILKIERSMDVMMVMT